MGASGINPNFSNQPYRYKELIKNTLGKSFRYEASLNEDQVNILTAIHSGKSSQEKISEFLHLENHIVGYYLDFLKDNGFIQGKKYFPATGASSMQFIGCRLTDKGKVAAENPIHLIEEKTSEVKVEMNFHAPVSGVSGNTKGNLVVNTSAQTPNLDKAVAEIQQILDQLQETYPTGTTSEQMTVATEAIKKIESKPKLKQKVINAAKEASMASFEETFNNPIGIFITGAIRGWLKT